MCDVVQILCERRQAALKRLERVGRDARGHLRNELLLQGLPARDDGRGLVRAHETAAPPVAGVARAQQVAPGDRRRCRLVCTDKAAPIIARGQALQEQFAAQMSAGLAPEALETFQQCLTAFAQNLDRMANREES